MTRYISKTTSFNPRFGYATSRFETDSLERAVDASWGENTELSEVEIEEEAADGT